MRILRRAMVCTAAAMLAAGTLTVVTQTAAQAHGAMMVPGSRTYLCYKDGKSPQGNIVPQNAACGAAVSAGGANALYNWFGVLRSDGAGRMAGFIPDGKLCSGGNPTFSGFDVARADFPVTHLTAGASVSAKYNNWAKHPGTFYLYVTKDSWSPTRPLAWSDLESTPFNQVTNPTSIGGPGSDDGHYAWTARLPSGKSGRHIIYSVWSRSDSKETFYNCSDVVFDGGNGQVTGVGGGTMNPDPGTTDPDPGTGNPDPGTGNPDPQPGTSSCTASYQAASTWNGGFQGTVTVANTGSSSISGWTVSLNVGSATISALWNGTVSGKSGTVTVRNAAHNGAVAPNSSTNFGFTANGSGTPTVSCTAG